MRDLDPIRDCGTKNQKTRGVTRIDPREFAYPIVYLNIYSLVPLLPGEATVPANRRQREKNQWA
eukprot:m.241034 g.241034  ORF g.241034 m.241034 type:complete len:64 (+) comp40199_c0_seq18:1-192(+)